MNETVDLYRALIAGKLWAAALTAGDLFLGCMPEAKKRYPDNHAAENLFVSGALDVLDRTYLYVSEEGYITRIERNN